jgi:hypothetical protein
MKKLIRLFVTFEIAKELKALGYKDQCFGFYLDDGKHKSELNIGDEYDEDDVETKDFFLAPLYAQIIDWLREEHGIILSLEKCLDGSHAGGFSYYYEINLNYDVRIPTKGLKLHKQSRLSKESDHDDTDIVSCIDGQHYDENPYKPLEIGMGEALKLVEQLKKQK